MGYQRHELRVIGLLSDHGGPKDVRDAIAWNQFAAAVRELAAKWPYNTVIDDGNIDAEVADETDYYGLESRKLRVHDE
jgi:hypothetical protein